MWLMASYGLATLAVVLIAAGLAMASNRNRHVPLMLGAFAADMVGLLIVELVIPLSEGKTDPVSTLAQGGEGMGIRWVHASFATLSVVGYILQIRSGRRIMKGDQAALVGHRKVAKAFVVVRLLAYVTMFMLPGSK